MRRAWSSQSPVRERLLTALGGFAFKEKPPLAIPCVFGEGLASLLQSGAFPAKTPEPQRTPDTPLERIRCQLVQIRQWDWNLLK